MGVVPLKQADFLRSMSIFIRNYSRYTFVSEEKSLDASLVQVSAHRQRNVCQDLLDRYEAEGDEFLDRVFTGDDTWCHHY